jgi:hypothetical protein
LGVKEKDIEKFVTWLRGPVTVAILPVTALVPNTFVARKCRQTLDLQALAKPYFHRIFYLPIAEAAEKQGFPFSTKVFCLDPIQRLSYSSASSPNS